MSLVDFDAAYAGRGYCDIPEYDAEGNLVFVEDAEGAYVLVDGEYVPFEEGVHDAEAQKYSVSYISIAEKYKNLKDWNNGYGYIVIDEDNSEEVLRDVTNFIGSWLTDPSAASGYLAYGLSYDTGERTDKYDWANVGLLKVDEYTIDYILEAPSTEYYFLVSCTSNWIVYEELYEASKSQKGALTVTEYGTSLEKYMSFGPYKVDTYEKDKQITMSRNENWYGWTDGKHEGQYQTTNIVIDIIADENTIENLFLTGKLDGMGLNASQLSKYRNSEYLLKTDQTYTFRFIFMSNLNDLQKLEAERGDGNNLQVLSYDEFRMALSLSFDRAKLCAQGTGGYKPAYYLFNSLYYYDVENDPQSIYRNTEYAKQAVLDLYGISYGPNEIYKSLDEAYEAVTGYDMAAAKVLFQKVYDQAIADGTYTAGQKVVIQCMATGAATLSEDDTAQERLLNEFVTAATAGTSFEGLISF
jgi:oligopeptide transport system substrate-binding protein